MTPSPMPTGLATERGQVLHKVLRELPLDLLGALLRGVRRHSDSLAPGALSSKNGACAVGMMLHELRGTRPKRHFRWRSPTILEDAPRLAREHPRLAHLEFIFDRTCEELAEQRGQSVCDVAQSVGMWVASEVAAEINLRHMEQLAESGPPTEGAFVDPEVFDDTVARVRKLRPWLSEAQATAMVESAVGVRRVEDLYVPSEWDEEVELQKRRLAGGDPAPA